jgi:hypothetical protein
MDKCFSIISNYSASTIKFFIIEFIQKFKTKMSKSDITYDISAFDPKNIPENTKNVNNYLISQALNGSSGPAFWEVCSNLIISMKFIVNIRRLVPRSFEVSKTKARLAGRHPPSDSTMQHISIFHLVRMDGR